MSMYQVKPISGGDIKIDLPTCMYKLPNVHAPRSGFGEHAHQNGELDPAMQALEARQDQIMRRLYELKAAVEGLAKTVTTPDADLDATTIPRQGSASTMFTGPADLDSLLGKDPGALRDIVINAHPSRPPMSLLALHGLLCKRYRVLSTVHVHSSIASVPPELLTCLGPRQAHSYARQHFQLGFTLIWKDVPKTQMKFGVQTMCPVEGEGNVARFLYGLLSPGPGDPVAATLSDVWVDTALWQLSEGGAKERAAVLRSLDAALARSPWLAGSEVTLADIICACCVQQCGPASSAPPNVQRWLSEVLREPGPLVCSGCGCSFS